MVKEERKENVRTLMKNFSKSAKGSGASFNIDACAEFVRASKGCGRRRPATGAPRLARP